MRQVFRLFTYDLIGMSTLLLPGLLAGEAGVDGVFAILAGTAAALCYVRYLGGLGRTMKSGFLAYCEEKLPVFWEKLVYPSGPCMHCGIWNYGRHRRKGKDL